MVREFGWGLLPQRPTASEARTELPPPLSLTGPVERESDSSLFVKPSKTETVAPVQSESALIPSASIANPAVPLKEIFLWLWLAVSGMFVVRLLLSLLEGARLVAGAHPLEDEKIEQAVASAATELDLRTAPEVFRSNRVRCPLIWSWRHRTAIVSRRRNGGGSCATRWLT